MSTALTAPRELERSTPREAIAAADAVSVDAGQTLDALMAGVWGDLRAGETTACPLCRGAMRPRHSAGAGVVGGRCDTCAASLA